MIHSWSKSTINTLTQSYNYISLLLVTYLCWTVHLYYIIFKFNKYSKSPIIQDSQIYAKWLVHWRCLAVCPVDGCQMCKSVFKVVLGVPWPTKQVTSSLLNTSDISIPRVLTAKHIHLSSKLHWFHATSANLSLTTIATFFASLLCFTHCSAFKTDSHNSFWFWNSCRALGRSVCNTPAKLLGEHWANMLWDQALAAASSINSKTKLRSLSVSSFNHSGCSPSGKSSGSTPKSTARNRFKEL